MSCFKFLQLGCKNKKAFSSRKPKIVKNKDDIIVQHTYICSKEEFSKVDDEDGLEREIRVIMHFGC